MELKVENFTIQLHSNKELERMNKVLYHTISEYYRDLYKQYQI